MGLKQTIDDKIREIKREVLLRTTRSQGPGGQNVNRTNSAVQLRWNIRESMILEEAEKFRVMLMFANQINSDGELLIKSSESRDQKQNITQCYLKLEAILKKALHRPKKRIATKPSRSSQVRRLDSKKAHAQKKESRQNKKIESFD